MSNCCLFFEYSPGISVSGLFCGDRRMRGSGSELRGLEFKV